MRKSKFIVSLILIFSVIFSNITVFGATDISVIAPTTAKVKTVLSSDRRVPLVAIDILGSVNAGDTFYIEVTDFSFFDGNTNVWLEDYGNGAFLNSLDEIDTSFNGPALSSADVTALASKVKIHILTETTMLVEAITGLNIGDELRIPLFGKITGYEPSVSVDNNGIAVARGTEKFVTTEMSGFEIEVNSEKVIGGEDFTVAPIYFRELISGVFKGSILTLKLDNDFVFEKAPVIELTGQLKDINHSNPLIIKKTKDNEVTIQRNTDFRTSSEKSGFVIKDLVIKPANENVTDSTVYLHFSGNDIETGKIPVAEFKIVEIKPEEEEEVQEEDNMIYIAFIDGLADKYTLNNEEITLDMPMYIDKVQNRTMIPLRAASVMLGVKPENVKWDNETRVASILKDGITYSVKVAAYGEQPDKNLYVNGEAYATMDIAPVIVNGSSYIPVSYFADFLGVTFLWEQSTKALYFNPNDEIIELFPNAATNLIKNVDAE